MLFSTLLGCILYCNLLGCVSIILVLFLHCIKQVRRMPSWMVVNLVVVFELIVICDLNSKVFKTGVCW